MVRKVFLLMRFLAFQTCQELMRVPFLIESHALCKSGGTLLNKINSISQKNPVYAESLTRGAELLKGAGYPGF